MTAAHAIVFPAIRTVLLGSLLAGLSAPALPIARCQDCVPGWETFPDMETNAAYAVCEHDGIVYRGGWFSVFRWTGIRWEVFGGGISGDLNYLFVADFASYGGPSLNGDGPLILAGYFPVAGTTEVHSIATWDGTEFGALGSGVNGEIQALAVYNGDLIAGGLFTVAGGAAAHNIARWDGSAWYPLGAGVFDRIDDGTTDGVSDMVVWNGDLYVAGDFTHAGDEEVSYLARWDGSSWSGVGGGVSVRGGGPTGLRGVDVHGDNLVIVGSFDFAGGTEAVNIARWDGSHWFPVGGGSDPYDENFGFRQAALSVASYQDRLYVGADFSEAVGPAASALAVWDGQNWAPVDGGLQGDGLFGPLVYDLEVVGAGTDATLLVGGEFDAAGGTPTDQVARFVDCVPTSRVTAPEDARRLLQVRLSPNPASPATRWSLLLRNPAMVTATLFDAEGRRIVSLLHRPLPAGEASFDLNLEAIGIHTGGVYYLRVEAAGSAATQKLVRVR